MPRPEGLSERPRETAPQAFRAGSKDGVQPPIAAVVPSGGSGQERGNNAVVPSGEIGPDYLEKMGYVPVDLDTYARDVVSRYQNQG